jgi:formate hydrogenlyase subunit 4
VSGQLAYGAILIAIAAFVLKTGLFVLSVAGIESTMAKFRIFRVPDLLFTSLVLGMIALSIIMTI